MNRIQLIVNADDFSRSPGVNRGILKAHHEGIVSTTTVLMNSETAARQVLEAHADAPGLGFGVHLNITYGRPISAPGEVASLLNSEGYFTDFRQLISNPETLDISQVEREWRNQIERFLHTDIELDHLDSHHHCAVFSDTLFELFLELADAYDCGIRNPLPSDAQYTAIDTLYPEKIRHFIFEESRALVECKQIDSPDGFLASFFAENTTLEHLERLLENLKPGTYELMCHPGFSDPDLAQGSSYVQYRDQELAVLTDPRIKSLLRELTISLHTFKSALAN